MDEFTLTSLIFVCVWMSTIIKLTFDQMKLFRAYKENVDPDFPAEASSTSIGNTLSLTKWRLCVTFGRYPEYPIVDKLAVKAQRSVLGASCIFVIMFIAFLFV